MPSNWKYWIEGTEYEWADPDSELPEEVDLFYEPFQQQFVDRVNEVIMMSEPLRRGAGLGTLALVPDAAGADLQDLVRYTTWWSRIESAIQVNVLDGTIVATSTEDVFPVLSGLYSTAPRYTNILPMAQAAQIDASGGHLYPRQAYNDEAAPVFQYRDMRSGDRIGKWVFEDVRRFTSRIRYMIGKLTSVTPHAGLGIPTVKYKLFQREEEGDGGGKDYTEYVATWNATPWVISSTSGLTQEARISYTGRRRLGWMNRQYHLRHLWLYHSGVVSQQHQWALYMVPRSPSVFRDDESLGLTVDQFKLINSGTDTGPGYHDEGTYYGSEVPLADVPDTDGLTYGFYTNERAWLVIGMDQQYVG